MKTIYDFKFITEPEIVLKIINILKKEFNENIFPKYNQTYRDPESYYWSGHCPSFARILYEIFYDFGTFFEDFSYTGNEETLGHSIVKIGDHFYHILGFADALLLQYPNHFSECPNLHFLTYEDNYCSKHEHNDEIEKELIVIGKNALQKIILNHNEKQINKLCLRKKHV